MKYFFSIILLVTAFINGQNDKGKIIGYWESVTRSPSGIGKMIEFNEDETFTLTLGVVVNYVYDLKDSSLLLVHSDPTTKALLVDSLIIDLNPDSFEKIYTKNDTVYKQKFKRISDIDETTEPLIGVWENINSENQPSYFEFKNDKTAEFRLAYKTESGEYSLQGDTLTLSYDNGFEQKNIFTLHPQQIRLKKLNNMTEDVYNKVDRKHGLIRRLEN